MEFSACWIVALNDILVCLLPAIFFRRDGRLTISWFFTALPYAIAPPIMFATYYQYLAPARHYSAIAAAMGVSASAVSILVIGLAIGTHRIPLALWHQKRENDAPQCIVDWGIYRRVRHPIYSAFILLMVANALVTQSAPGVALLLYVSIVLTFTAKKEERRLSNEPGSLGAQYRAYAKGTGRFLPLRFFSG